MIRLLVADDHVVVREGLAAILNCQTDMQVVAEAEDGRAAVALWRQHRPDVAMLDLRMPGLDAVGVVEELRADEPSARFIVLTTYGRHEDVFRATQAGVNGYLLKDAPREALLECIRRVHAGGRCIPSELQEKLAAAEVLTARELDVLRLLACGQSNKEMARGLQIGEATVKSHLKSIFAKLQVTSRTEAVSVATQRGLVRL